MLLQTSLLVRASSIFARIQKITLTWLLLSMLYLLINACSSTKPITSTVDQPRFLAALPVSQINIPVVIHIKQAINQLDSSMEKQFTSINWPGYDQSGCDFRYRYRFIRSPFTISCINNKVTIRFRGNYQIAGSKTVCAFGKQVAPWVSGSCGFGSEALRRVDININSQLDLLPSQQIRTLTWLDKLQPIDKCEMTLLQTDMTGVIMDSIRSSIESYTKTFDQFIFTLNNNPALKEWRSNGSQVMPISDYGFLNLNPTQLRIGKFNITGDSLRFSVGFTGRPEFSSDSSRLLNSSKLPPVANTETSAGIKTYINTIYQYDFFNKILNDSLRNKPFDIDGRTFVINEISVGGTNTGKIFIDLQFSGNRKGTLHLEGTPFLDSASQVLSMPDINFALDTKDMMVNMAKGLFRKKILRELKNQTVFDIAALVERNKALISSRLNQSVTEWMQTAGTLHQLKIIGVLPQKDHVQLQFYIDASIALIGKMPANLAL